MRAPKGAPALRNHAHKLIATYEGHGAGKCAGGALYLHVSAVSVAEQAIRDRIERAVIAAAHPDWNVAKVQGNVVSLLTYEAFDEAAFPALLAAVRITFSDGAVVRTDYRDRANPPILLRKESLLRLDDPRRPAFAALTQLAEEHKLFAQPRGINTRKAWLERVAAAGFVVQGAKLLHLGVTENLTVVAETEVTAILD